MARYDYITTKPIFEELFVKNISGCWVWTNCVDKDGYGVFWFGNKNMRAHRFSWELYKGEIPANFVVCHTCDNPSCVNPAHLFTGSQKDNIKDMHNKKRHIGNRKIDKFTASKIRTDISSGLKTRAISEKYNISIHIINNIKYNNSWATG